MELAPPITSLITLHSAERGGAEAFGRGEDYAVVAEILPTENSGEISLFDRHKGQRLSDFLY